MPFIKGARSVNPDAELRVIWVNSWYDPGKERQAAMTLLSQDADVSPTTPIPPRWCRRPKSRASMPLVITPICPSMVPNAHLTATTHHWGDYYVKTVKAVQAGTWKPFVWGGFQEGMIKLAPLNDAIPAEVRGKIEVLKGRSGGGHVCIRFRSGGRPGGTVIVPAGQNHDRRSAQLR